MRERCRDVLYLAMGNVDASGLWTKVRPLAVQERDVALFIMVNGDIATHGIGLRDMTNILEGEAMHFDVLDADDAKRMCGALGCLPMPRMQSL
jgi:hypothetical protein